MCVLYSVASIVNIIWVDLCNISSIRTVVVADFLKSYSPFSWGFYDSFKRLSIAYDLSRWFSTMRIPQK
jgi:hypothetical protein